MSQHRWKWVGDGTLTRKCAKCGLLEGRAGHFQLRELEGRKLRAASKVYYPTGTRTPVRSMPTCEGE